MLYSLLVAVIFLSIACPFMCTWCFIKGYNTIAIKTGEKTVKVKTPNKQVKQSDSSLEAEILLANIERYDGTSEGQKEFK